MSNKISRDYSQNCRKLFWSSLEALVLLSLYHSSVVLLEGHLQWKQERDDYVKCMGLVWVAKFCAGLYRCFYRCLQTDLCLLHICCSWPHGHKSQFEGAAMLILCAPSIHRPGVLAKLSSIWMRPFSFACVWWSNNTSSVSAKNCVTLPYQQMFIAGMSLLMLVWKAKPY